MNAEFDNSRSNLVFEMRNNFIFWILYWTKDKGARILTQTATKKCWMTSYLRLSSDVIKLLIFERFLSQSTILPSLVVIGPPTKETHRRCHRYQLRLRHAVILISSTRISALMKVNRMLWVSAWIRSPIFRQISLPLCLALRRNFKFAIQFETKIWYVSQKCLRIAVGKGKRKYRIHFDLSTSFVVRYVVSDLNVKLHKIWYEDTRIVSKTVFWFRVLPLLWKYKAVISFKSCKVTLLIRHLAILCTAKIEQSLGIIQLIKRTAFNSVS